MKLVPIPNGRLKERYNAKRLLDNEAKARLDAQINPPSRLVKRQPNFLTTNPETGPMKKTIAMEREPTQAKEKWIEKECFNIEKWKPSEG